LLKAPVAEGWEQVRQVQKAFEDGLLEAFQKAKERHQPPQPRKITRPATRV